MNFRAKMPSTTMDATDMSSVQNSMKDYYGKVLSNTDDLQTSVCKLGKRNIPKLVRDVLKDIHVGVTSKYYGCGTVVPEHLEGMSVLDLGSGSGQDCYVLSKLVGEKGKVVGLDMTEELLETSRQYIQYHTDLFEYKQPNISFVQGYIEKLAEAGLKDNTFDIIISNCVICLSADKRAVLEEAYRVLKVGGEMYFSDLYADRRIPEDVRNDKTLWGEGYTGALWWEDLVQMAKEIGFSTPLPVTAFTYAVGNEEWEKILGDIKYVSTTYRLFKPPTDRQPSCDVIYKGAVTGYEDKIRFDNNHTFKTGEAVCVIPEIATILKGSRFRTEFSFQPCASEKGESCCNAKEEKNPFNIAETVGACPAK